VVQQTHIFDLRGTFNTLVNNDLSLILGSPTPLCQTDALLYWAVVQVVCGAEGEC